MKEVLTDKSKDDEKRIYNLIRDGQDLETKLRQNATVIRDLVEERDKFKHHVSELTDEIEDLNGQVTMWRSSNTELKLIEEKVECFLSEVKQVLKQHRHSARPVL